MDSRRSEPASTPSPRTLWLLRHAEAVAIAPGRSDADRPLTAAGRARAAEVGEALRASGTTIDLIVCSPALRTRQTVAELGTAAPLVLASAIYNAGSDTIVEAVSEAAAERTALTGQAPTTILVVGHAPGVPALVHDLADPERSSSDALSAIDHGYPPATLCRLEIEDPWDAVRGGRLVSADTGRGRARG